MDTGWIIYAITRVGEIKMALGIFWVVALIVAGIHYLFYGFAVMHDDDIFTGEASAKDRKSVV